MNVVPVTIGALARGSHTIAITYSGDANFLSTAEVLTLLPNNGLVVNVY